MKKYITVLLAFILLFSSNYCYNEAANTEQKSSAHTGKVHLRLITLREHIELEEDYVVDAPYGVVTAKELAPPRVEGVSTDYNYLGVWYLSKIKLNEEPHEFKSSAEAKGNKFVLTAYYSPAGSKDWFVKRGQVAPTGQAEQNSAGLAALLIISAFLLAVSGKIRRRAANKF